MMAMNDLEIAACFLKEFRLRAQDEFVQLILVVAHFHHDVCVLAAMEIAEKF